MTLRLSADERCLFCTSSARKYQLGDRLDEVDPEELEILWSTCLECGFSVPTSGHEPRAVYGDLERVERSLEQVDPLLILPAEAVVYFHPAGPQQLVNACREAGFDEVHLELLGDELVAREYLRLWREMEASETVLRSTSPIVVEYVRHRHPDLLTHLAPIVTPAVALARYLRASGHDGLIVSTGLDGPPATDAGEDGLSTLTLSGLELLLERRGIVVRDQPDEFIDEPPVRSRHLSVAGGLPLEILETERLASRRFRKVRNLKRLASIEETLRQQGPGLGFVDVLPFDGALDHPALGPHHALFLRRKIAEEAELPRSEEPLLDPAVEVDLSVDHTAQSPELEEVALDDVVGTLDKLGIPAHEVLTRGDDALAMCPFYMGRRYEKAIQDSRHDALTGLYTFGAFEERLEEEVARANREGTGLGLVLLDLDDFKSVNDRFGHNVGNEVLRAVATAVRESVRKTDVTARFGGDEVVVILVNPEPEGTTLVGDKIREAVAELEIEADGVRVPISASVGLAYHSGDGANPLASAELFAEADTSLYIAKAQGGDRVHPMITDELIHDES